MFRFRLTELLTMFVLTFAVNANADSLVVNAGLEYGPHLRGADLVDDRLSGAIGLDWSSDVGAFAGADCFYNGTIDTRSWRGGCAAYLGYFSEVGQANAFSVQLRRWDFDQRMPVERDFTELTLDWFFSKNAGVSVSASDSWFGRGFRTVAVDGFYNRPLGERMHLNLSAGLMTLESAAPVDNIPLATVGFQYELGRTVLSLESSFTDKDKLGRMAGFEIDQPELNFSLKYRLY